MYLLDKRTLSVLTWAAPDDGQENIQALRLVDGAQMATNGHGLACLVLDTEGNENAVRDRASVDVTLRAAPMRQALRLLGKRQRGQMEPHEIGWMVVHCGAASTLVDATGEDWVDWWSVVPQTEPKARIGIDATYLRQVAESAEAIGATAVKLEVWDHESPMRWTAYGPDGEELVIILMPRALTPMRM